MDQNFKDKIQTALLQLDHSDDSQWTEDGLPVISVVQRLANDPSIKRNHINEAQADFTRDTAKPSDEVQRKVTVVAPEEIDESGKSGEPMSEDEVRAVLNQRVADAERVLEAARKKISEGHKEEQLALATVVKVREDLSRRFPPMTANENIKEFIASQNLERAAKAGAGQVYGSQLDAAMQRGNSRGWSRPQRGKTVALPSQRGA